MQGIEGEKTLVLFHTLLFILRHKRWDAIRAERNRWAYYSHGFRVRGTEIVWAARFWLPILGDNRGCFFGGRDKVIDKRQRLLYNIFSTCENICDKEEL